MSLLQICHVILISASFHFSKPDCDPLTKQGKGFKQSEIIYNEISIAEII